MLAWHLTPWWRRWFGTERTSEAADLTEAVAESARPSWPSLTTHSRKRSVHGSLAQGQASRRAGGAINDAHYPGRHRRQLETPWRSCLPAPPAFCDGRRRDRRRHGPVRSAAAAAHRATKLARAKKLSLTSPSPPVASLTTCRRADRYLEIAEHPTSRGGRHRREHPCPLTGPPRADLYKMPGRGWRRVRRRLEGRVAVGCPEPIASPRASQLPLRGRSAMPPTSSPRRRRSMTNCLGLKNSARPTGIAVSSAPSASSTLATTKPR